MGKARWSYRAVRMIVDLLCYDKSDSRMLQSVSIEVNGKWTALT